MRIFNALSGLSSPAQWLIDWVRGPESDSGVSVTSDVAMGYPPIWYGINKISGHIGQLPLNLHRRVDGGGSEHAITHPHYKLMRTRPNKYQTASTFKKTMMMHALLYGNGRAAIIRDAAGMAVEILPLMPSSTHTCLVNGEKWHIVTESDDERCSWITGSAGEFRDGKVYRIPDEDCIHIMGMTHNGYTGISLIQACRDAIGLGLAAQRATSRSFANGSKPGIILEAPVGMFRDDRQAKEFIDNFNSFHIGVDNQGKAALIREGMKISTVAMSAQDAQWLEQRQFQRIDVAMLLGLETLPGDSDSVSYSSLEQKSLAYLQNCLGPWLTGWEQECDYKLLNANIQDTHYFNFDESELLRTDFKTKAETMSLLVNGRIINPNEGRQKLGWNPYEGGDEFANPAITPGRPSDDRTVSPEDANRRAIVAHMRHLIGVEAKRVLAAAGNKKNYIAWLDAFYSESDWMGVVHRAVLDMGGDPALAINYVNQSKQLLIELAGVVTNDGLADAVSDLVTDWPEKRAEILADDILGALANV